LTEREIHLPDDVNWWHVPTVVDQCCLAAGLRVTLKATLAKHPGCVHWHFKRGDEPGTLEITVWPAGRRAWCSVQSGRRAVWIDEMMPTIIRDIESRAASAT
jgi:hypothetical protein